MVHETMLPSNFTQTGRSGEGEYGLNYMWIFAIIIVFFAIIFWGKKDERRHDCGLESVFPALALGNMSNQCCKPRCNDGCSEEQRDWDMCRDNAREFGNLKMEIKETGWTQSRESDKYFYETRGAMDRGFYENRYATDKGFYEQARLTDRNDYNTLLGFKNTEILGLQNTKEVIGRIDTLEKRIDQDVIRKQGEEISHLKTVLALDFRRPVYGTGVNNAHIYQQSIGADTGHFGYGYAPGYC